jgi:hypothetical protein
MEEGLLDRGGGSAHGARVKGVSKGRGARVCELRFGGNINAMCVKATTETATA